MKKIAVFLILCMVCDAHAATGIFNKTGNNTKTGAGTITTSSGTISVTPKGAVQSASSVSSKLNSMLADLPECDNTITSGYCLLMPGTRPNPNTVSLASGTITNNNLYTPNANWTICPKGQYVVNCGTDDNKIVFDFDIIDDLELSVSDQMDYMRNIWDNLSTNGKNNVIKYCAERKAVKSITCKSCPKPGSVPASTCQAESGKVEVYKIANNTATHQEKMDFFITKCQNGGNISINTFWNCDAGTGTDKTGEYEYRLKSTNTQSNCYPTTTTLP